MQQSQFSSADLILHVASVPDSQIPLARQVEYNELLQRLSALKAEHRQATQASVVSKQRR